MLHSNIIRAIEMGDSQSHTWALELANHMSKSHIKDSSCTLLPRESAVSSFLLEPAKHETGPAGSLTYQRSLINFIFNCLLSLHLVAPEWLSCRYDFTATLPIHYQRGNTSCSWGQRAGTSKGNFCLTPSRTGSPVMGRFKQTQVNWIRFPMSIYILILVPWKEIQRTKR